MKINILAALLAVGLFAGGRDFSLTSVVLGNFWNK